MSCESLSSQPITLNVSFGSLPEGFCPASMQDLGAAIAARLIITPNQSFTSFAIGSLEPTSNVGPWLKDCEEWFVWDDATARYVPIRKQGTNEMQYIQSSQSFEVPPFVYRLKVHAWGGGGGGGPNSGVGVGGGGGGAGGYGLAFFNVLPGQIIPVTVGMGGAGGTPGAAGGNTSFLTMTANGGGGGTDAAGGNNPGAGGSVNGATFSIEGGNGTVRLGGDFGGSGGNSGQGGPGGTSNSNNAPGLNGKTPGGGGAGGTNGIFAGMPGNGANGGILIEF